jgi:hypothetical protein
MGRIRDHGHFSAVEDEGHIGTVIVLLDELVQFFQIDFFFLDLSSRNTCLRIILC